MLDLTLSDLDHALKFELASSYILMWTVFIMALTSPSPKDNFRLPGGYKLLSVHLDQTKHVFCALLKDEYVKEQI